MEAIVALGTIYTMVRDLDHGNVESPQNTSKDHHLMKIQKSFMCEFRLSSVM
jgi:hypothetical protein